MLNFVKLIDWKKAVYIFLLGLVSGAMSFLFLGFINVMIEAVLDGRNTADVNYLIFFCFLMLGLIWTRRALSYIVIKFSQRVFWNLRAEVLRTILKANFYQVDKRRDKIYASLVQDVGVLTGFSLAIISFLGALIMTVGCFVYMALQSAPLFYMTLIVAAVGIAIYWVGVYLNKSRLEKTRELEDDFMSSFLDIMDGFKEIHMNPKIGLDIYNRKIRQVSEESFTNNTKAYSSFLNIQITGEVLFYTLIAFILLYYPYFLEESAGSIVKFVFILLYLLGGINSLMVIIPEFVRARIASNKINALREDLKDERFENLIEDSHLSIAEFNELDVTDLQFTYAADDDDEDNDEKDKDKKKEKEKVKDEDQFGVGPASLSIKKGESVFIYGGNGSGKTTMVNAILGILKADSGKITFNGTELTETNYSEYRAMFSVVFSDFHLFDELYGMEGISDDEINEYIALFELDGKVTYKDRSFSSNQLSTGQRKRLGLINALVRAKPLLVLDEWAADQDPVFRKKFYTEIIPILKNKGYSVIAITHDDAYYYLADKLYKMDHGKLTIEKETIDGKPTKIA
ncbi:MAG: putative ATP-binding cassette transporter [Crocinitomix sp.]|jgi:putative ATP-binding cassette transporter